jgi:hypothetical protein
MNYEATLDLLSLIQRAFYEAGCRLTHDFPSWNPSTDERITVFLKCCNIVCCSKLGLVFAQEHLSLDEWWRQFPKFLNGVDNHPSRSAEFSTFMKVSLILGVFSLQEAALRRYLRAVDADACSAGSSEFASIYEALFNRITLPDDSKSRYRELLHFFREIRNSIHNNMVYYPRSRKHRAIAYRGSMYGFGVDQPLDFVGWKLLLLIMTDIGSMLADIVRSPEVSAAKDVFGPANFELGREPA